MKNILIVAVCLLALLFGGAMSVAAQGHEEGDAPIETCPPSFDHMHRVHADGSHSDHEHPPHRHVGNDQDQNGDGWVCVKHTGKDGSVHVHTDNNFQRGQQGS